MRRLVGTGLGRSLSSVVLGAGRALRHQFWEALMARKWYLVTRFMLAAMVAISVLALQRPAAAEPHTYQVIRASVPFQFFVGDRGFHPGQYEFIMVGNGLLAIRDAKKHFIASLVTRSSEADGPTSNKLVFTHRKKRAYLTQIFLEGSNQVMEVKGEQLAIAPALPVLQPDPEFLPRTGTFNFMNRQDGVRLHD